MGGPSPHIIDRVDDAGPELYPTPPWAVRAFMEAMRQAAGVDWAHMTIWEPAAGLGHMGRTLAEEARRVIMTDIVPRPDLGIAQHDALGAAPAFIDEIDAIVTNPPFSEITAFALRLMQFQPRMLALLVQTRHLEGIARYGHLYSSSGNSPSMILQYVERVPMLRQRLDKDASTTTAYCWLVWMRPTVRGLTTFHWIPPMRDFLERPEDYAGQTEDHHVGETLLDMMEDDHE